MKINPCELSYYSTMTDATPPTVTMTQEALDAMIAERVNAAVGAYAQTQRGMNKF